MSRPAQMICLPCGNTHGRPLPEPSIITTQIGTCAWCGQAEIVVTSATDFRLWAPSEASQ